MPVLRLRLRPPCHYPYPYPYPHHRHSPLLQHHHLTHTSPLPRYNWPLRGEKTTLFEGGVRVAAFAHSPLLPAAARGAKYGNLMHIADWLPTLLHATGTKALTVDDEIDGVDHWPALVGTAKATQQPPRTELLHNVDVWEAEADDDDADGVVRAGRPRAALRVGKWKLIVNAKNVSWFDPGNSDEWPAMPNVTNGEPIEHNCQVSGAWGVWRAPSPAPLTSSP